MTDDERLNALIICAHEQQISLDLLEVATRGLDRASHDIVLENMRGFAQRFTVHCRLKEKPITPK